MEQLIPILSEQGLPGIVIVGLAYAYWRKDQALERSNADRIADNDRLYEALGAVQETLRIMRASRND